MCVLAGVWAARTLRGGWRFDANYITRLAGRAPLPRVRVPRAAVRGLVPVAFLLYALAVRHMPTDGPIFGPLSGALGMAPNTGFAFYDSAGWVTGYARLGQIPTAADVAAGRRIVDYMQSTEQSVLSEEAGFSLSAGRDVITNPTQLQNLYNNGLYDPSALVALIEAQRFGYVVLRAQFYPLPVLQAIHDAYAVHETIPMNGMEYIIMAPKPVAD
jgi:hypothetical protein